MPRATGWLLPRACRAAGVGMSGSSGGGKSSAPRLGGVTEQHRPRLPYTACPGCPWEFQRLGGSSLPSTAGTPGSGVVSSPRGCACSGAVTAAGVALPAQQGCHGGCARAGLPFSSPAAKRAHSDHRVRTGIEKRNVETAAKLAVLLSFLD